MSDLQRAWAKNKLSALPPATFDERDEDAAEAEDGAPADLPEHTDDDSSSASSASSTGTIIPSPSQKLFARPQGAPRGAGRTMQQTPWTAYFERELFLTDPRADSGSSPTYHAYLSSPVGKGPLFIMHHGAGSSGLSFAVVGAEIRKRLPSAGILSVDARGHGYTKVPGEEEESGRKPDLSLQTLASDLDAVIRLTQAEMRWSSSTGTNSGAGATTGDGNQALPPIVLVGHSLGGAVVTELALRGSLGSALLGYTVLDVVEGSAIDALQSMHTYLSTRPAGFASVEAAIDWHVRSRTVRNSTSARVSVPALLRRVGGVPADGAAAASPAQVAEEQKPQQNSMTAPSPSSSRAWVWRTDLAATQPFWEDWFVGLSKKFLGARGGKLLLLAGTDRLDTELTIGQMQGKYALQVFPEAGHFIHEDLPEKTAVSLVDFHRRNDRSALVLPPKVSDLLAQGKRV